MSTLSQQVLKREQTPISFEQIKRILKNHTTVAFLYLDDLKSGATTEQIFGKHDCVAILVDLHTPAGKETTTRHWVSLIKRGENSFEFFDSLGNDINRLSAKSHSKPTLFEWSQGKKISYNSTKLQRFSADVNSCGCWVATRLIMKHLKTARAFVHWISHGGIGDLDLQVSYLCFFDLIK